MSENAEDVIGQIEISIEQAKEVVDVMKKLQRLTDNQDFKDIVLDGYFLDEASRLVLIKAEPSQQSEKDQKLINDSITAIGHFRQYLSTIMQTGKAAEHAIGADEQTIEEILAEQSQGVN